MADLELFLRPLRLKGGFVWRRRGAAALAIVAGAGMLIGMPAISYRGTRALLSDRRLWDSGVEASVASVHERAASREGFFFKEYDLKVEYIDRAGRRQRGRAQFTSFLSAVDRNSQVTVRYDPGAPERFVPSWAVDVSGGRWAYVALTLLVGVLFGVRWLSEGPEQLRRLANARAAVANPDEIEVEVVRATALRWRVFVGRRRRYSFRITDRAGRKTLRFVVFEARKHAPLFTDQAKTRMLAICPVGAPQRAVVLRDDFYPLDISQAEAPQLQVRLERRRAYRTE